MNERVLFETALGEGLHDVGLELAEGIAELCWAHWSLLQRWNTRLNLTRVNSVGEAARFHYAESVLVAARIPRESRSVIDIGSGGGFPGLLVGLVRPELEVRLVEAHQRKAVFLKEASRGAENISVIASRVEAVTEGADVITSRAVARQELLPNLRRLAPRFVVLGACSEGEEWVGSEGIAELERVILPWGHNRCVLIGVTADVPRGTSDPVM